MKTFCLMTLITLCFWNSSNSDELNIREYFNNTPKIQLNSFNADLILKFNYSDTFLLKSNVLKKMYPDSIINTFDFDNNPCYAYGKYETKEYFSIVVLRAHGEWLKTLDLLSYNYSNELLSMIYLAGLGNDARYTYCGWGKFINDSTYKGINVSKYYELDLISETEKLVNYDSTVIITNINQQGKAGVVDLLHYGK